MHKACYSVACEDSLVCSILGYHVLLLVFKRIWDKSLVQLS